MLQCLAMASFPTQSLPLLNRISSSMRLPVLLWDPVRVLHSSPVAEQPTDTDLMTEGIIDLLVWSKNNSPGDNSVGLGIGDVDEVEVLILVCLAPRDIKPLNDYYRMVPPTQSSVNVWRKSKLAKQSVQQVVQDSLNVQTVVKVPSLDNVPKHSKHLVSCHVANHVQYAISKGLPQKKGIRPAVKETKIKLVKGASFVNHCISAKSVPNVPSVVKELGVGGRLQTFWLKWQELGANPRVVSILREGYALPFKMRPPWTRFPLIKSGYANLVRSRALSEALVALREKSKRL